MGVITRAFSRTALAKYVTVPAKGADSAYISTSQRRVGPNNATLWRNWSVYSEFIRAAIDIRAGQVQTAGYDFLPFDREGRKPDPGKIREMRRLLEIPNPTGDGAAGLLGAMTEDLLVLDAGVIEKERSLKREIRHLWAADGQYIKIDRFWSGNPKDPRYFWCPNPTVAVPIRNDVLLYARIHPRSNSPVGVSYLETLKMAIEAELTGSLYNARQVVQAAPDGIMDMGENARPEQVAAFQSFFENELAGQSVMGFWGGTKGAKFIDFKKSNRDQQFIEWQLYEVRKIAAVFQLSVQDLQILGDVNRANAEVQQQNTEDRGQRTLLNTIQNAVTSQICWDESFGGRENNICFRYPSVSDRASLAKAEEKKLTVAGMPVQTINQARADMGWAPEGDPVDPKNPFNKYMANTPLGLVTLDQIPSAYDLAMKQPKEATSGSGQGIKPSGGSAAGKPVKQPAGR